MLPHGKDYLKTLSNPKTVDTGKSVRKVESEMRSYGNGSRSILSPIVIRKADGAALNYAPIFFDFSDDAEDVGEMICGGKL